MLKKFIVATALYCFTGMTTQVIANESNESVEHILWDKTPLQITLPVGSERLITFPSAVEIDLSPTLHRLLRTQINDDTVYWKADKAFKSQRIVIRAVDNRVIYLVDLQAKKRGASKEPIRIVLKKNSKGKQSAQRDLQKTGKAAPGYIDLTRFAAQQLYSPQRLIENLPGVHRVPVSRKPLAHLIYGMRTVAHAVASWRSHMLYVTAVEIKNLSHHSVILDPRNLRGRWKAATFQHVRPHPVGDESDTTAVYLVSNRPFNEVIDGLQ